MRKEDAELLAEHTVADVVVAVAIRSERRLRVVHVERAQPVEPDLLVDLGEHLVELRARRDVVTGDVEVARVEADAQPLVLSERRVERGQLVDRTSDRVACARRVLDQEPGRVRAPLQHVEKRRYRALEAGLETRALVRADVEDDAVRVDRAGDVHSVLERRARLVVDLVLGAREVGQVEGVAEDSADPRFGSPLLEALEVGRVVVRRAPRARALREDLDAVAADRLDPVDRGMDPARGRDMGPELHASTLLAWPFASVLRPARRATCTSAAPIRRSSTGSSRAMKAASSCSGSRTP